LIVDHSFTGYQAYLEQNSPDNTKTVHSSLFSGDMIKIEDNVAKRKGVVSRDQVAALKADIIVILRSDIERSLDVFVSQED
jgi:hypothetical protein